MKPVDDVFSILWSKFARNTLIGGIIIAILWSIGNILCTEGLWVVVVNIGFLILSLFLFWLPMHRCLNMVLPGWFALLITTILWAAIFVGIRSLILNLV